MMLDGTFNISKKMMRNAVTYMPVAAKRDLAKDIARLCVEGQDVAERNKPGESLLAFPPMLAEDIALKNMLLLNTLLGHYFKVDIPENDEEGKPLDSFLRHDYYAGGHILNQIERFKSDDEFRSKAFNILADYKEFKKMVDTEIFNLKERNNDVLARFVAAIQIYSDPKVIKELMEKLFAAGDEYRALMAEKGILRGEEKTDG